MLDTVEATLCCVDEDESDLFETSIYGLRFAVSSNEPSFMAWVRHHFSALDCSSPARAGAPGQGHFSRIHVHISDDGEHVLSAGVDYPTVGSHSWGMMQAYTERAFTRVARRHMAPMYVVHAGAVAYQGRGLLFPAFPGSGKSTLVAGLALSGFDYYNRRGIGPDHRGKVAALPQEDHAEERRVEGRRVRVPGSGRQGVRSRPRRQDKTHGRADSAWSGRGCRGQLRRLRRISAVRARGARGPQALGSVGSPRSRGTAVPEPATPGQPGIRDYLWRNRGRPAATSCPPTTSPSPWSSSGGSWTAPDSTPWGLALR